MTVSRIYLDANVFLHAALQPPSSGIAQQACRVLNRAADGSFDAVTSALTWDEVVWNARHALGIDAANKAGRIMLAMPGVTLAPASAQVLGEAQKIAENTGLKPRDAIHAATALLAACDIIVSDDSDFDAFKRIKRISVEKAAGLR